jgi:hypothetical protein
MVHSDARRARSPTPILVGRSHVNVFARLVPAALMLVGAIAFEARGEVSLPPFYAAASTLKPESRLGQVLKKERVNTRIPGATAWRLV